LPSLRERLEDIPTLVGHFLRALSKDVGRDVQSISPEALEALGRHHWPGNVRELQNVVHRSLLACRGDEITLADLPPDIRELALPAILPTVHVSGANGNRYQEPSEEDIIPLRELERRAIQRALRATQGSVGRAAKLLGIGRATLYRRIATLDLSRDVA
jgi:two-component system response regulator HydG